MGFLSVLKSIGHAIDGGVKVAAPLGATFGGLIPGVGPLVVLISGAVMKAEQVFTAPKAGVTKLAAATTDVLAGLELAKEIAATQGKVLKYDAGLLQAAINAQVAALNAAAAFKASLGFESAQVLTASSQQAIQAAGAGITATQ